MEDQGLHVFDEKLETLPIERKEIIEFDARLRVSGLERLSGLLGVVGDPFGLAQFLSEDQQREMLEAFQTEEAAAVGMGEADVAYPAIIATPIAIYR